MLSPKANWNQPSLYARKWHMWNLYVSSDMFTNTTFWTQSNLVTTKMKMFWRRVWSSNKIPWSYGWPKISYFRTFEFIRCIFYTWDTSSQSNIFDTTCQISSSIMGRGCTIFSTTSSSTIPSELPFLSAISILKTSTWLPSSSCVGLLLGLYARWFGSA